MEVPAGKLAHIPTLRQGEADQEDHGIGLDCLHGSTAGGFLDFLQPKPCNANKQISLGIALLHPNSFTPTASVCLVKSEDEV